MRVGSLFTGYGGLDMAIGGDLAWYAEIEKAACQVLAVHHPGVPNLGDITAINWDDVEPVDILTGGYPCQPFSHAGNRKGKNDERHLWPYVLTAIRAIRPRFAILENVSGHLTLGFDSVLTDLAEIGWAAEWGTYRASDVGAPHRRERLFIVAYATRGTRGERSGWGLSESERATGLATRIGDIAPNTSGDGYGQQLHAGAMAGVEGQATGSTQQRQRARGESDPGSVDDAANTEGTRLQRREPAPEDKQRGLAGRLPTSQRDCNAADTDSPSGKTRTRRQGRGDAGRLQPMERGGQVDWGKYAPAIRRWESVLDRPAPTPTVERKDKRRLNPQFVEWMMGLPAGWVTGHGLSAAQELKMLGNGVVPQQAHAAITQLMQRVNT